MKGRISSLFVLILVVGTFVFWGCPKSTEVTSAPEAQKETPQQAEQAKQADQEKEKEAEALKQQQAQEQAKADEEAKERAAAAAKGLQPVYFDFDKSAIRSDARQVMKENADWLKANPTVKVRIEGNCDERGTIEYNQALGQRRAASAKKYLTDLGISGKRITLISYGKEKPVCTEHTEECWQKNRKDSFVAE